MQSLILIMAVLAANAVLMTDGDAAFLRVNNRDPAHTLAPGTVARAVNCRFDQGQPRPRFGVALDGWGIPLTGSNVIPGGAVYDDGSSPAPPTVYLTVAVTPGQVYRYVKGNSTELKQINGRSVVEVIPAGDTFVALSDTVQLQGSYGVTVTAQLLQRTDRTCAYKRFSDPDTDSDQTILITDEWRTSGDGGRGRAWRIIPGNTPQEIDLNGHDVWGTARLVQCDNAMLLLRHGNGRHYFTAADVNDATNDRITLHVTPPWAIGTARRVKFELAQDGSAIYGATPPGAGNYYYAKHVSAGIIEFYTESTLTTKLNYSLTDPAVGKFYIEYAVDPVPFFGNGAPVLIMQPDGEGSNAFENGFKAADANVRINGTVAATDVMTARNHRFTHGDSVTGTAITGVTWPAYAAPQSDHTLKLYDTEDHALADDGTTGLMNLTVDAETGTIWKTGASQLAMPPLREGIYYKGRLLGINGFSNIVIGDVGDFLHFEQFKGTVPTNFGEAGRAITLLELGEDALLLVKQHSIYVVTGLSGDSSAWYVDDITKEFGGLSALAALNVGSDAWLLTRKGVASIVRTVAGQKLATVRTVSETIPEDLRNVDWGRAGGACAEVWNNRYLLGLPTKGQITPINNTILVANLLNQTLQVQQTEAAGDVVGRVVETGAVQDAWEGSWNGPLLTPYAFAKLMVNGEERLTYATPDGLVAWLHDGWTDLGQPVKTEWATRAYFGGRPMLTLRGAVCWDSFHSLPTVRVQTAGYNESEALAGMTEVEYDRTRYLVTGQTAYDPNTSTEEQFDAPHREDYSPSPEELLVAKLDVHQTITEPLRLRVRDRSPQLVISNARGSLRVNSCSVQGKPVGIVATRQT